MNKNKDWLTLVGFTLVILGFLSLALSLVGLKLSFLVWLDRPGPLFGFLAKLAMIVTGLAITYLAQTDFRGEEE
jgi:hypothetical protein